MEYSGTPFFVFIAADLLKTALSLLKEALFFLLIAFASLAAEQACQTSVSLHQFAHHQERVDGGDAVGDKGGNIFAFAAVLALREKLIPHGANLLAILVDSIAQLLLAQAYFLQRAVGGWGSR